MQFIHFSFTITMKILKWLLLFCCDAPQVLRFFKCMIQTLESHSYNVKIAFNMFALQMLTKNMTSSDLLHAFSDFSFKGFLSMKSCKRSCIDIHVNDDSLMQLIIFFPEKRLSRLNLFYLTKGCIVICKILTSNDHIIMFFFCFPLNTLMC